MQITDERELFKIYMDRHNNAHTYVTESIACRI